MLYSDPSQVAADEREAMMALRSRGVAKVVIHFSGGNDSGGADDIEYLDAAGNEVTIPNSSASQRQIHDPQKGWITGPWQVYEQGGPRDATPEEIKWSKVADVLEAPIYNRWGSFAGDFDVQGTVTWDTATGEHEMKGQESVWQDFSF